MITLAWRSNLRLQRPAAAAKVFRFSLRMPPTSNAAAAEPPMRWAATLNVLGGSMTFTRGGRWLVFSLLVTSCALLRLDSVTAEQRSIVRISDESRKVIVLEPMVWMNAPEYRASKGIRLRVGSYTLVAEDADYLYFQSPEPIEMRVLENGVPVDGRDLPGGLALAKGFNIVPAATYIDVDAEHKMLVMKHGSDFLQMEGRQWKKSW